MSSSSHSSLLHADGLTASDPASSRGLFVMAFLPVLVRRTRAVIHCSTRMLCKAQRSPSGTSSITLPVEFVLVSTPARPAAAVAKNALQTRESSGVGAAVTTDCHHPKQQQNRASSETKNLSQVANIPGSFPMYLHR
jgi:hypothetical protein